MDPLLSDFEQCEANQCSSIYEAEAQYQDPAEQVVTFYDDSFTCPIEGCAMVYTKSQYYRKHRVKHHGLPRFSCVVCSAPFDSYNDLIGHMALKKHLMSCVSCTQKFVRPGEAHNHYNQKHKLFSCAYCLVRVTGKLNLQTHLQCHYEETDCLNAALYVEVALDSSFSDLPLATQAVQDDTVTGSDYYPNETNDEYSTSSDPTPKTAPTNSAVLLHSADSPNLTCSDIEPHSETDLASTNIFSGGGSSTVSDVQAVVFGPGASEFFSSNSSDQFTADVPRPSSLADKEDDASEWMGHNVEMYQTMSEKHKKTYRYNCNKCSCTFSNKDILKRHLNIHDFICKYCFLRFNSLSEYKSHLHEQHSKPRNFHCSVCGHSLQGLKSLMIHEMVHRLNFAFKCEAEDAELLHLHREQSDNLQCKLCERVVQGFSKFVRHVVWHNWDSMWKTYVTGRIFKGTFTEDEARKFGKEVAEKLETKWRDCSDTKVVSTNISDSSDGSVAFDQSDELHETDVNNVANEVEILESAIQTDGIDQSDTIEETGPNGIGHESTSSENEDNSDDKTDSEAGENTNISLSDWMNYWSSYLGIDETPPSWVKPIMKNLCKQWKSYNPTELTSLYKQMDQISVLIRAQKNEASTLDGPSVLVERLPTCYFQPKINHDSTNENLAQKSPRKVTNVTANGVCKKAPLSLKPTNKIHKQTSNHIKKRHGPASARGVQSSTPSSPERLRKVKNGSSEKGVERAISTFLTCLVTERVQVRECTVSLQRSPRIEGTHENLKLTPQPGTCEKFNDLRTLTVSGNECVFGKKRPRIVLSRISGNEGTSHESSQSAAQSYTCEKLDGAEPLPKRECRVGFKRPLVMLSRVDGVEPVAPVQNISDQTAPCCTGLPSTSDFRQMVEWTRKKTGCQLIPAWASFLIDCICKGSVPPAHKRSKMQQVISLIKIKHGIVGNTVQMPVVKVNKCL